MKTRYGVPLDVENGRVELSHGSGGRASSQLVDEVFRPELSNEYLDQGNDYAAFPVSRGRMVMSTDVHVVSPLFFPGGDIGSLSIHGTVNDVAMAGARPLHLSAAFVLEEGFPLAELKRIAQSMGRAARESSVAVVAGDTKVVERGKGDGVFIATTGIGLVPEGVLISGDRARPGDAVLLSGTIGDHGIAILAARNDLGFRTNLCSDTAPLHTLVADMVAAVPEIRCLRDPTRGGLGAVLNELANQSDVGMVLQEHAIPVRGEVQAVCELLGIDPLYVANEGKLVAICPPEEASRLLATMRNHPLGRAAMIIGEVVADQDRFVRMKTRFGGSRVVHWLSGDQLPRIC